jgi:hypothetical protein
VNANNPQACKVRRWLRAGKCLKKLVSHGLDDCVGGWYQEPESWSRAILWLHVKSMADKIHFRRYKNEGKTTADA